MAKSDGRKGRPWRRIRADVLRRDNHQCRLRLSGCTGEATTVDHIIPRSRAPWLAHNRDNLIAACGHCNSSKGAKLNMTQPQPTRTSRQWT
jgi:5-methylcytosine-specific restriction protein A